MTLDRTALFVKLFGDRPSKREVRKLQLIESAIKVIASKGPEGLTYEAMGEPLGMSRANVVYYFKSKEAVLVAALQYVIFTVQQLIVEELKQAQSWQGWIQGYIDANIKWMERYPEQLWVRICCLQASSYYESLRETIRVVRSSNIDRLSSALQPLQAETTLTEADLRILSMKIINQLVGWVIDAAATQSPIDLVNLRKNLSRDIFEIIEGTVSLHQTQVGRRTKSYSDFA